MQNMTTTPAACAPQTAHKLIEIPVELYMQGGTGSAWAEWHQDAICAIRAAEGTDASATTAAPLQQVREAVQLYESPRVLERAWAAWIQRAQFYLTGV